MYYDLLSQVFCINALSFAKISICLSYLRILKGSRHTVLRVTCYLTAFLVFAVNTVVIISLYAQCDPPRKSWNPFIPGKCWAFRTEISLVLLQGGKHIYHHSCLTLYRRTATNDTPNNSLVGSNGLLPFHSTILPLQGPTGQSRKQDHLVWPDGTRCHVSHTFLPSALIHRDLH